MFGCLIPLNSDKLFPDFNWTTSSTTFDYSYLPYKEWIEDGKKIIEYTLEYASKDDVKIWIDNANKLNVEIDVNKEEKRGGLYYKIQYTYKDKFDLPDNIIEDFISAKFEDNKLRIEIKSGVYKDDRRYIEVKWIYFTLLVQY